MKILSVFLVLLCGPAMGAGTRLKDVVSIEGMRDNQLLGYGVVVGLNGTGDKRQTVFSAQALTNILKRMGVTVEPTAIQVRNVAGVMVTASLPPFAQPGTKIDITAAAIGDATNLQGGLLLMTSLKGGDGQVYAVAQGPILTGGFVGGRGGNSQTVNHPTVGRLPQGAIVERAPPSVAPSSHLKLQLREADFTTAARVADALNRRFAIAGLAVAKAESSAVVAVDVPAAYSTRPVEFIAEMENLTVESSHREKIVINERTGTVVWGKVSGSCQWPSCTARSAFEVQTAFNVAQPAPLASGNTAVTPETTVMSKESKVQNILLRDGATVEELVRALQAIGSTARDIIAILQNMRVAGALEAEIEVI